VISGGGFVNKRGTGTLALSGANTFASAIDVQAGALRIATAANLGPSGNAIYLRDGTTSGRHREHHDFPPPRPGTPGGTIDTATVDVASARRSPSISK